MGLFATLFGAEAEDEVGFFLLKAGVCDEDVAGFLGAVGLDDGFGFSFDFAEVEVVAAEAGFGFSDVFFGCAGTGFG